MQYAGERVRAPSPEANVTVTAVTWRELGTLLGRLLRGSYALSLYVVIAIAFAEASSASIKFENVQRDGQMRPFAVEDIFRKRSIGDAAVSPDGQAVAFTVRRPAADSPTTPYFIPQVHDDIWLQESRGRPRPITHGQNDGGGYWAPRFSPSGRKLAYISSHGNDVSLWVLERNTGRSRMLLRGIDFSAEEADYQATGGCRWVNDESLLCITMPNGAASPPFGQGGQFPGAAIERVKAAWERSKLGLETANAVDSDRFPSSYRSLVRVDASSGATAKIADVRALGTFARDKRSYWPSPDGRHVIISVPGNASRVPEREFAAAGSPIQIAVFRIDGSEIKPSGAAAERVLPASIRWAPDSRSFAFFARSRDGAPIAMYSFDFARNSIAPVPLAGVQYAVQRSRSGGSVAGDRAVEEPGRAPGFMWFNEGLAVEAVVPGPSRSTWLVRSRSTEFQDLGNLLPEPPRQLIPLDDGRYLLAVASNDVWKIDLENWSAVNLTTDILDPVVQIGAEPDGGKALIFTATDSSLALPSADRVRSPRSPGLALSGSGAFLFHPGQATTEEYWLDLRTGLARKVKKSASDAAIIAASAGTGVFFSENRGGTHLWRVSDGVEQELISLNEFWKLITPPERQIVSYVGIDGQELSAIVTLPAGYKAGQRYPVVVESDLDYGEDRTPALFRLRDMEPPGSDAEIFSAHGYVHVFASMPTTKGMDNIGRANLLMFTHGIVPAAEKVIALGMGDAERLYLYGESSMGFGVLGLITQTSRFKAAVSAFGWADQLMQPYAIGIDRRYSDSPFGGIDGIVRYVDNRQPTWHIGEFVRRNSPFTYVDRVQTPILLMDADFDLGNLENSEAFFAALVQQRKPARFVRFWGEVHGLRSPPNIRRYWSEVFSWYGRWDGKARSDNEKD